MSRPKSSAKFNGKVSPIDDGDDRNGPQDAIVVVPSGASVKPTQEKQRGNFISRLFRKKSSDEKNSDKKKPAGPKLKLFEIVSASLEFESTCIASVRL